MRIAGCDLDGGAAELAVEGAFAAVGEFDERCGDGGSPGETARQNARRAPELNAWTNLDALIGENG